MRRIRLQIAVCGLAALTIAACASSPPEAHRDTASSTSPDAAYGGSRREDTSPAQDASSFLQLQVAGAMPLFDVTGDDEDTVLASNVSLGAEELLQYEASYYLSAGDIVPPGMQERSAGFSPSRVGSQRLGQNVNLRLPKLAGAPAALAVTSEFGNNWMVTDDTRLRREHADFSWSPGPATVNLQWISRAPALNTAKGLACTVQTTIRLPTRENAGHSGDIRFSGQECTVAAAGTPYAGIEARTWGLSYVWSRPQGRSSAELSVIDPAWSSAIEQSDVEPGYELGFSHRRDFGTLSASALLSLRQSSLWQTAAAENFGTHASTTETRWTTDASLTWKLPTASVSANWAQGVDPLWFTPDYGERGERFGLSLDLSRWLQEYVPGPAPQLAMNWNWSQLHLADDEYTGNNSLKLDVALAF